MTAYLRLNSWAGTERIPIEIVGETSKRYRVKLLEAARLPGNKQHAAGAVVLVPKYAVQQKGEVWSVDELVKEVGT
jgi:hypothetical protein